MSGNLPRNILLVLFAAGLLVFLWEFFAGGEKDLQVGVAVPQLSELAATGKEKFDAYCLACHGANGAGTPQGPPLVHDIYNPGHHPDEAFFRATARGTPQHHWGFGDMPPVPQASLTEVGEIVRYIRELQEENGIFYRPHRM